MGNCLVSKLKSEVNNDNLHKLTDIVFNLGVNTTISNALILSFKANASGSSIRITGDAYFMSPDPQNPQSLGKSLSIGTNTVQFMIYSPKEGSQFIISDPENLLEIDTVYAKMIPEDINQFQRFSNLSKFTSSSTYTRIETLAFSNLPEIRTISGTALTGSINSIVNSPKLYSVSTTSSGSSLTGDAALVEDSIFLIITGSSLDYTTRATNKKAVILRGVDLGNRVDAYLNNFIECIDPNNSDYKSINVKGTRTSASDAAVATLKSRGYSVKVNDETL